MNMWALVLLMTQCHRAILLLHPVLCTIAYHIWQCVLGNACSTKYLTSVLVTKEAWIASHPICPDHESNHWILNFCSFLYEFKLVFWILLLNNVLTTMTTQHSNTDQTHLLLPARLTSSGSVRTPDNWTIWSNELSIVTSGLNNGF